MSLKLPKYKDDHILTIKYGTSCITTTTLRKKIMIATISEKLIENFSKKFCDKKLCFSSPDLQLQ